MKEYKDITLFEFPIQQRIKDMPLGAVFMARIADGFYIVYIKVTEHCIYSMYSIRRENGVFEKITYKKLREEWSKPFNKGNLMNLYYGKGVPYYSDERPNTYEIGFVKPKFLEMWKLTVQMTTGQDYFTEKEEYNGYDYGFY